jgi:hypothetical protein
MLTNKKQKEIIYKTPNPSNQSQTMIIESNKTISNMNNLIQEKYDDPKKTGSDIYITNNPRKREEEKSEESNQSGIRLIQNMLKKGLIFESVDPFKESGDIFKKSAKKSVTEIEDDIPEYDYLSQKIIDANL